MSGAIEWAPRAWQAGEPHDPFSVAAVGLALLHTRDMAVHDGRLALRTYVQIGIAVWIEYLTS